MKRIIISIIATLIYALALAIPAKPGFVAYTQPDGSVVKIRLVGDEHGHMIFSEAGQLLIEVDGYLEFADFDSNGFPVSSGIKVSSSIESKINFASFQPQNKIEKWANLLESHKNERIQRQLSKISINTLSTRSEMPQFFGRCHTMFPVEGEQKGLVILVEYEDVAFTYGDFDYFDQMLNEEGFSAHGSMGSARDWFILNSNGKFVPEFDVYGPVLLPHKRAYYGANDPYGDDKRAEEMIIDACSLLDDIVDFSEYDRDGDGNIDNVFVFYAGNGEHDSNVKNAVWPHSWYMSEARPDEEFIYDGVRLEHYACSCEFPNGKERPDGIGTFVHEFSHVLGLPDLYVTTYTSGFTPGEWCVMDQGPYNNDGLTPPNYSSFEKNALGWIEFKEIEEGLNELPDLSSDNVALMMPTDNEDEYYFFENRQQLGSDRFLPGHGMLVWHVDYDAYKWDMNTVNNSKNHQNVDLIEADDEKTDSTRAGDAFPGPNGITAFGHSTSPQLISWSKQRLAFDIVDITESEDGIIRFNAVASDPNKIVGIEKDEAEQIVYYDLAGRRVLNPGRGIYIMNGKKIIK